MAFDQDGAPIPQGESWSEKIPCAIKTASSKNGRYEDGEFTQYSYEVLLEELPISPSRIRLEKGAINLGDFKVLIKPEQTSMGRIKIIV